MSEWVDSTVGAVTLYQRAGGTPTATTDSFYGGDIPFVTIEDITNGTRFLDRTEKNLSEAGLANSAAWLIKEPHILYSMYATVGKPIINRIACATNQAIIALKRSAKKGWDKLGVDQKLADEIIGVAGGPQNPGKPTPVKALPKPKAGTKEKKAKVSKPTPPPAQGKGTKAEQARSLYDAWQKSGKADDFAKLADFKKKAKKGWAVLGFSDTEIKKIESSL